MKSQITVWWGGRMSWKLVPYVLAPWHMKIWICNKTNKTKQYIYIYFIYLVDFVSCLFLLQSCELTHVTLGFSHYLSSACRKNIIYKIIKIPNAKLYFWYCIVETALIIMKGKSRLVLNVTSRKQNMLVQDYKMFYCTITGA